jgi:hypothetical protein
MMKRMWRQALRCSIGIATAATIFVPSPAQAQITRVNRNASDHRQAIGVTIGGFFVKPEDSRDKNDDVLFADLDSLVFNIKDFNGGTFGGEWLIGLSDYLEAGVNVSYYQRSVPSVYRNVVNTTGAEIAQDLKLRIVPLTATVRFLPIGHASVEPYVGAGIGAFRWRYSETGEFVDFKDNSVFRDSFVANGTAFGPVVVAGLRVPFGDMWDIGGEARYQKAEGDTSKEPGLLAPKIDLGGWTAAVTFHVRF